MPYLDWAAIAGLSCQASSIHELRPQLSRLYPAAKACRPMCRPPPRGCPVPPRRGSPRPGGRRRAGARSFWSTSGRPALPRPPAGRGARPAPRDGPAPARSRRCRAPPSAEPSAPLGVPAGLGAAAAAAALPPRPPRARLPLPGRELVVRPGLCPGGAGGPCPAPLLSWGAAGGERGQRAAAEPSGPSRAGLGLLRQPGPALRHGPAAAPAASARVICLVGIFFFPPFLFFLNYYYLYGRFLFLRKQKQTAQIFSEFRKFQNLRHEHRTQLQTRIPGDAHTDTAKETLSALLKPELELQAKKHLGKGLLCTDEAGYAISAGLWSWLWFADALGKQQYLSFALGVSWHNYRNKLTTPATAFN